MKNVDKNSSILVAGAGGFIGGHLVRDLLEQGYRRIRAVDIKPMGEWFQVFAAADNRQLDLRGRQACLEACDGVDHVFNLASDMGGMGYIETHKANCMLSVLINTHLLAAAVEHGVGQYFYASSACVYNAAKQARTDLDALREDDAYPADPEDGYGWEKLFSERMCRHFTEDFGLETRIARFHNVYGPYGTWDGGREKAPAAICRKVIEAKRSGDHRIDIWGDGRQTRSFTFIDDALYGIQALFDSDIREPINLGSDEMVSINELVDIVEAIAGVELERRYDLDAPKGVRGRNSDNTLIREKLGWAPSTPLRTGMHITFDWINDEIRSGAESKESQPVQGLVVANAR